MTPTQFEAQRRIKCAKQILEFTVQAGLSAVANDLSRIIHCPEYDEVAKLYDRVKALWYKLDSREISPKIDLDSEAAAKFLASLPKESA